MKIFSKLFGKKSQTIMQESEITSQEISQQAKPVGARHSSKKKMSKKKRKLEKRKIRLKQKQEAKQAANAPVKVKVYHLIVLDESGSMTCVTRQTISGCNETIQTIRTMQEANMDTQHHIVSIYLFDSSNSRYIVKNQTISAVKEITEKDYSPKDNLENEKTKELTIGTRDLFLDTLSKIGCQYELGETEEDCDKNYFAYQGENFTASANNEGWYVHIWDTYWGHVELYDIDEFARLKKAINHFNLDCATMTVYTIDEAGSNVDVHYKSVIPFIPQIPEIDKYLRGELNDFFRAHQYVGNEMAKQREAENVL